MQHMRRIYAQQVHMQSKHTHRRCKHNQVRTRAHRRCGPCKHNQVRTHAHVRCHDGVEMRIRLGQALFASHQVDMGPVAAYNNAYLGPSQALLVT